MKLSDLIPTKNVLIGQVVKFDSNLGDKFTVNDMTFVRTGVLETLDYSPQALSSSNQVFECHAAEINSSDPNSLHYDGTYYYLACNNNGGVLNGTQIRKYTNLADLINEVKNDADVAVQSLSGYNAHRLYSDNQIVFAFNNSTSSRILIDNSTNTWTSATLPFTITTSGPPGQVFAASTDYYFLCMNSRLYRAAKTLPTPLTWNVSLDPNPFDIRSVASNGTVVVAVGINGKIHYSTDQGSNWTSIDVTGGRSSVTWTGKEFLVTGANSNYQVSTDGINWQTRTLVNILSASNNSVVTGYNGYVYYSTGANASWWTATTGLEDMQRITIFGADSRQQSFSGTVSTNNSIERLTFNGSKILSVGRIENLAGQSRRALYVQADFAGTPFISPNHYMRIK